MSAGPIPPLAEAIPLAVAAIRDAQSLVLACHVNPDGDALGSLLGLAHALQALGKQVTLLSQDGVPEILSFLPGSEKIRSDADTAAFDLAVVLDSGDLSRVGARIRPSVESARRVLNVDHHMAATPFGDIRVLDAAAASTAEIVYALLGGLGSPMTAAIATCLYTGIITDTGSFRFQNVTPNTLRVAAALLEAGAPPAFISENVFENRTFAATYLLGLCLSSLSRTPDGRVVWAHITPGDFARAGATDEDTEGIVNYIRAVRRAEVGILFRDVPDTVPSRIRISLRSHEAVNVAKIAERFGGGGHRMAAGCSLALPLAEAEGKVIQAVCDVLAPPCLSPTSG